MPSKSKEKEVNTPAVASVIVTGPAVNENNETSDLPTSLGVGSVAKVTMPLRLCVRLNVVPKLIMV